MDLTCVLLHTWDTEPMTDAYEYGAEHDTRPGSEQLAQLSQLVDDMAAEEERVAQIEDQLRLAKARVRTISQNRIPELMAEVGVSTITTSSGMTVSLKTIYRASPKVSDREAAWQWLENNGHGGLLKRTLAVAFAKGEEDEARELREHLEQNYSTVKEDRGVHSSTLKAWAREMIENGVNVPHDLFGIEVIEEAKVKRPTF